MRIATCITHVDIHRETAQSPPSPLHTGQKREKKKRFGEYEEGRAMTGERAGVGGTEAGSTKRAREQESACCSEALYPSVERELGAQCYDGHQADRSQPLSASSAAVHIGPYPPSRSSDCQASAHVSLNRL